MRNRVRLILFFTPWVSVPLALLGIVLVVAIPIELLVPLGWIVAPVALVAAVVLAIWLRPRYELSILDSSPLGVFYWLKRRV